jgi:hypothetical protein
LLDDMRQFVRKQTTAGGGRGLILACAKRNVIPDCVRVGVDGPGGLDCPSIRVDADGGKILPKARSKVGLGCGV